MRTVFHQHRATFLRWARILTGADRDVIVTPPPWRLRITRCLVAAGICLLAYQAYAWLVVPMIEPASALSEAGDSWQAPAPSLDPEIAALFAEGDWERDRPMVLTTNWGTLLFREYVTGQNGLELRPCTILFRAPAGTKDGQKTVRTVILQAPQKAVLSFAGGLNLLRAEVSELEGALLEGAVRIYSPQTAPDAQDALSITTSHVQIRPTQVWTPYDVSFQYGASRGSGRGLSLTLAPRNAAEQSEPKSSWVQSINMLELTRVDTLHLDFPGKGLLGETLLPQPAPPNTELVGSGADNATASNAAVDVTCQGPFRFDFQTGVATLEDHVDVVRLNPLGSSDQLHCDQLSIHFQTAASRPARSEPAADAGAATPAEPDASVPALPKMAVTRIEARGQDVTLQAPSVEVAAHGQLLQYDFASRHILLQDERTAQLSYRQHVTRAPQMEYELPEDPQRLGKLWAQGPGTYRGTFGNADGEENLEASWRGTMELQPQEELHVLSVVEGAEARWGSSGLFTADKLFVWLAQESREPPASKPADAEPQEPSWPALTGPATEPSPASETAPPTTEKKRLRVQPVKMLAQGHVRVEAEQYRGTTSQLEVWFDHATEQLESKEAPAPPAAEQPTTPPAADAPVDSPAAQATRKPPKRLELSGNQIRLRLRMIKPRPALVEASLMGQVRCAQMDHRANMPPSLLITGETLQVRSDQFERYSVDVRGQPARVDAHGMLLEGADLHLAQRENLMWSAGPGRMRLPGRATREAPAEEAARPLAASSPIWINWQGGMDFDGQLVRFLEQVEVSAIYAAQSQERYHIQSIGHQLHATLNRYVAFDKANDVDDLDVVELRFLGEVFTKNQTYDPSNVLVSQDHMKARDLLLDRRTGQFQALGPGWISSTRVDRGEFRQRLSGEPQPDPATVAATRPEDNPLIYLRVDFENAFQGNVELREGEFVHFVRTVYGPVASWDQTLDPDRPGGLGPKGILLTCHQLQIAEIGASDQRSLQLAAVGNTIVEGDTFVAKADRLTYDQGKDQLVFEGLGHNLAVLQQRNRAGQQPLEFQARKIMYWIRDGNVEVFDARQLDYNQIGSPSLPNARIR